MPSSNTSDLPQTLVSLSGQLLEMVPGEVNLVRDGATVELNLHDVRLLLPPSKDLHLSVDNDSDHGAVLLHLSEVLLNLLLTEVIGPLVQDLVKAFFLD